MNNDLIIAEKAKIRDDKQIMSGIRLNRVLHKVLNKKILIKTIIAIMRSIVIIGISFIILEPILIKISMSLMSQIDLYDKTVKVIPKHFMLSNFEEAYNLINYTTSFLNTAGLALLTGILQTFACIIVGYGFAHFHFRYKGFFFALVIISMVIPPQLILTPLYLNFKNFDLFGLIPLITGGKGFSMLENVSPFVALSITATGPRNGLYIFLARQFFRSMPREIDEAASIDGAGPYKVFFMIMLGEAIPVMVTIFLFSFVWQWNDSLYTFLFYTNLDTIPKYLQQLGYLLENINIVVSASATNVGYISIMRATCTLLAITPLLVIYAIFQKHFIQSIERTGLVG